MAAFPLSAIVAPASPIGVLDVGASFVGEPPPYQPLLQSGAARLIGFEPDVQACEKLRALYGPPSMFFPYFIGDGRPGTYYQTNWAPTGSLFKPNRRVLEAFQNLHEVMTLVAEHPVQTKRLDDIEDLGDVDFIKLDVQGAELMVLQGAQRVLKDVSVVQVEVEFLELYENQPLFADVDRFLRGQGFAFHTFFGFGSRCFKPTLLGNDPNKGIRQLLWSDAVYVRDWSQLAALSEDKIAKYATLLHDVIGSPDLCLGLLMHLDSRAGTEHGKRYLAKLAAPQQ
jgi:FkbM family methyltransferase